MSLRSLRALPLAAVLAAILTVALVGTAVAYVVTDTDASPEDIHTSGTATVTLDLTATTVLHTELVWLIDEGDSVHDFEWVQPNVQMLTDTMAELGMNGAHYYYGYSESVNYGPGSSIVSPPAGGDSHTAHAIQWMLDHLDPASAPTTRFVLFVVTDGNLGPGDSPSLDEVIATVPPNVDLLAIGRGEDVNLDNLALIAGTPDHLFVTESADEPVDRERFRAAMHGLYTMGDWWPYPGPKHVGATDIEVTATVAARFGAPSNLAADRGSATATGHEVTWSINGLADLTTTTESATLTYEVTVACDSGPGGLLDLHDSITYTDTQGRALALGPVQVNLQGCAAALDLAPAAGNDIVGSDHIVTATVTDDFGDPVSGAHVDFEVTSGPHAGTTGSGVTDASGEATFTYAGTGAGLDSIVATAGDLSAGATFEWLAAPLSCDAATASHTSLWAPNKKFHPISVVGVGHAEGDPVTVTFTGAMQDEPLQNKRRGQVEPDVTGIGTDTVMVRADRAGNGDGRVYHLSFTAEDGAGGVCSGVVNVSVPHNQSGAPAVDGGPLYDSTSN